jgi:hypothetical protein
LNPYPTPYQLSLQLKANSIPVTINSIQREHLPTTSNKMASMSPSLTPVASIEALYKKLLPLGTAAALAHLHPNSPEHTPSSEAPVVAESSNSGWKRTRMASEEGSDGESIPKRSRKATSESPNSVSPKPAGPKDKRKDDDSGDNNNDGDEFRRFLVKPGKRSTAILQWRCEMLI